MMSDVGTVSFGVDGKWLTDFIRQRFFYENKNFDDGGKA